MCPDFITLECLLGAKGIEFFRKDGAFKLFERKLGSDCVHRNCPRKKSVVGTHCINHYLNRWNLSDPTPFAETPTSQVYRVCYKGRVAVLKVLTDAGNKYESSSAEVLRRFKVAAPAVLKNDDGALLMEFIDGCSLKEFLLNEGDAAATQVICETLEKIHNFRGNIPSSVKTMRENFSSLFNRIQDCKSDLLLAGASVARRLLESEKNVCLLHGDVHHKNILYSSTRGWLLIDPHPVVGERAYDFANTFYNPDDQPELVESVETIQKRAHIFSRYFNIDAKQILEYALAFGCLSACWAEEDKKDPSRRMRVHGVSMDLILPRMKFRWHAGSKVTEP